MIKKFVTITKVEEKITYYTIGEDRYSSGSKWFPGACVGDIWELTCYGSLVKGAVLVSKMQD